MRGNEIRVSARTVLDLLAGKIDYEHFPETYKDFFQQMTKEGRVFSKASIETDTSEMDDDWLLLNFGEPDPSVTPFHLPDN
jgi:hypothetical protein